MAGEGGRYVGMTGIQDSLRKGPIRDAECLE